MTSALLWLALAAAPCAAQAPSTAPARGAAEPVNPWSLAYGVDRRGDRYGRVEYRLRWSFDDLSPAPPGFDRAHAQRANFGELTMRGLLQSSRVELYGVMVRPFRDLPLTPREDAYVVATSTDAAAAAPPAPARRRRLYTWDRLYQDLEFSARRESERFLIREGFDHALPAHRGAPYSQKKALSDGLLEWGRSTR